MYKKIVLAFAALLFATMACSIQTGTPSLPAATPTLPAATETPTVPPLPMINSPQISSLIMLDADYGWAINDTSVLRTINGGMTWYDATPAGVTSVWYAASSFFLDAKTSWILIPNPDYTSGTLYQTTDGGVTWSSTPVNFSSASLDFTSATDGWALVGLGAAMSHEAVAVFRTSDGGITWTQVFTDDPTTANSSDSLPFVGDKTGIAALDVNHAWVTGAQPSSDFLYIYTTGDGGSTWAQQEPTFPAGYVGAMTSTYPPHFFSASEGVLPAGLYSDISGTVFYITQDGGQTWSPSTPVAINGQHSIASKNDFFVWDGGPALYASHDAGTSWSTVAPNINIKDILGTFQFVNATTGWALTGDANGHHSLYKTEDGGVTWAVLIP
jgi:photosystem II stability/assembly factor-like uncharacterized protein